MNKYIIDVYTNWCGEDDTFCAIADSDSNEDLNNIAAMLSYDNFAQFSGFTTILEELFPEVEDEEYTDEMIKEAMDIEGDYYGFTIREATDEELEYWEDYELVYDGSQETI